MTTPPEPPQGDAWQNTPSMSPESQGSYPPPPPGGGPGYGAPQGYGGQPGYGGPPGGPGYGGGYQQQPKNGMAIAALVLGILGLLTSFIVVGGVLGVLAVIFGFVARGKVKRGESTAGGMAISGIVLGIIAVLITIAVVAFAAKFTDEIGNYADCVEQAQGDQAEIDACAEDFANQLGG